MTPTVCLQNGQFCTRNACTAKFPYTRPVYFVVNSHPQKCDHTTHTETVNTREQD